MINQTLEYVKSCSLKAKKLQHLSEHLVTNGPEGTVLSKCFKSLELLKKSLQKMEDNIKELSTYPGFNIQLNLEAILTLHVENQHAVTHFKRDTFTVIHSQSLRICPYIWVISRGSSEACLKMGCSILHSPGIVL